MKSALVAVCSFLILSSPGLLHSAKRRVSRVHPASPTTLLPAELVVLASRADQTQGWPGLARYARSVRDPETRGLAYFVLGYREYEAHSSEAAQADLDRALETSFSLRDFAAYYRAAAARDTGNLDLASRDLADFNARFPSSSLRVDALRLETFCLIGSGHPQDAIRILSAAPDQQREPALQYLLCEAQSKASNLPDAARCFEDIYYRLPGSPEATPSATALKDLQSRLGPAYPVPSEDLRTTRASALEKQGRFDAALSDYAALMRDAPASPLAAQWRLGRDRCLMGLGRSNDAIIDLALTGWASGNVDAERELMLVRGRAHSGDESGMRAALADLARDHANSTAYASALDSASFFYLRQGDWQRAGEFNLTIARQFPNSDLAAKAQWQSAWAAYLVGRTDEARQQFTAYLLRYPDTFRVPAALYWLGRIAESDRPRDAAWFYTVLQKRFGYYPLRAYERLKILTSTKAASPSGASGAADRAFDPIEASGSSPPAGIDEKAGRIPPLPSGVSFCPEAAPGSPERPALVLAALGLDDIAIRSLRARLQVASSDSSSGAIEIIRLRLAMSRIERDQQKFEEATLNARRALPNYTEYDFSMLPFDFWNLLYPEAFWDLVRQNARVNGVDPYLVMALIRQESGFNPKAISGPGARGLMQLRPPTANQVARERASRGRGSRRHRAPSAGNLSNPSNNLRAGCRYLSEMIREFNGSLEEALAAYNAGPERVRQWLNGHSYTEPAAFVESIPFPDTRAYVEALLRDQGIYRRLLGGSPKFKSCPTRQ